MRVRTLVAASVALAVLASVVLVAQNASNAGATSPSGDAPTVEVIMRQAMARAQSQDDASAELAFESLILTTVEHLNGDELVNETETSLHRRYALEGALYEELIERDGEPLNDEELEEERKRQEEFRAEARAAAETGEAVETGDERQIRFDEELMGRYRAALVGEQTLDGERCWVVDFEPREGKLPDRTRFDKALNKSTGRLYVSQQDHGIKRIEFALQEPVRYLWGLVASLTRATGSFEFTRVEPNVWLPQSLDLRIDVRVFFRTMRRHVMREWVERARS